MQALWHFFRLTVPLASFAVLMTALTGAHALQVSPLSLEVNSAGSGTSGSISVVNTRDVAMPMETSVFRRVVAEDGTQELVPDDADFLVFPPAAVVEPGATQVFRIQWLGDPTPPTSESFYLNVAELPVELPEGTSGVQLIFRFNIALHVAPEATEPLPVITEARLATSADGTPVAELRIENQGNRYTYTRDLLFRIKGGDEEEQLRRQEIEDRGATVFLPPHQSQPVSIPLTPGDWAEPMTVEVQIVDVN